MNTEVFPTPVGMNRFDEAVGASIGSVPHARGDEPGYINSIPGKQTCSPRPWG